MQSALRPRSPLSACSGSFTAVANPNALCTAEATIRKATIRRTSSSLMVVESTTRMMQLLLDLMNKQLEQGLQVRRGAEGAVVCSRVQHPTCC